MGSLNECRRHKARSQEQVRAQRYLVDYNPRHDWYHHQACNWYHQQDCDWYHQHRQDHHDLTLCLHWFFFQSGLTLIIIIIIIIIIILIIIITIIIDVIVIIMILHCASTEFCRSLGWPWSCIQGKHLDLTMTMMMMIMIGMKRTMILLFLKIIAMIWSMMRNKVWVLMTMNGLVNDRQTNDNEWMNEWQTNLHPEHQSRARGLAGGSQWEDLRGKILIQTPEICKDTDTVWKHPDTQTGCMQILRYNSLYTVVDNWWIWGKISRVLIQDTEWEW